MEMTSTAVVMAVARGKTIVVAGSYQSGFYEIIFTLGLLRFSTLTVITRHTAP